MRGWTLLAAIVASLALGAVGALLVQWGIEDRQATTSDGSATGTVAPSTPTGPTTSPPASASPSGSPTDSAPATPSTPARRIETTSTSYFGLPFETIRIAGRYYGAHRATKLRMQVRQPDGWTSFPLPVITGPDGRFQAYVELAAGQYQLRLLDPETRTTSRILTLLLF